MEPGEIVLDALREGGEGLDWLREGLPAGRAGEPDRAHALRLTALSSAGRVIEDGDSMVRR